MAEHKMLIIAGIVRAKEQLEMTLIDLEQLACLDRHGVAFTAHALNNYLTVTSGSIELMQAELHERGDIDVLDTWLDGLRHCTDLMTHLVSRLVNHSTPGGMPLRPEAGDLGQLALKLCQFYRRQAQRKHLQLHCEAAERLPLAWMDRVAVAAVLDNLLSNAVKYSPLGRTIVVQVWSDHQGGVFCSVKDDGPGISVFDQQQLYQRGVPLSALPTGGEPSTGYGLAIAKELIEQQAGDLWCVSEPQRGSTFFIRLPLAPPEAQDALTQYSRSAAPPDQK